ncbi:MAG: pyridoxamine 5'-phosphate oxidase family protein [Bradyrhizobium sp.]|uniref:MSMEG_1061 family FMN-dependent PPOX-type flavoprotein n=1 Tax=Bradyrhizobium sp. TaxID=376 RepID=UPI002720B88C|nr:MSMEG_1061 family FMN-dependent PPOX-type flavoprotein [Bradyrhizobium sp.]MDO8397294.1 pyridoxamine 5'-phosphate oxidase family protein [Bradyrhizobium sp.]
MTEKDVSVAYADGTGSAMTFNEVLRSEAEIDSIIGRPNSRVLAKVTNRLDDLCREFIGASPFLVVSSSDSQGRMDCSPKGDPAGFVHILDDWTLAIPERPGNRRADTFRNVLQNPKVGLIFLVPGKGETLRINGTARIVRDSWLREKLAHKGIVPELTLVVTVEEVFAHCTKCMVRSALWKPESWKPEGLQFTIGSAMVAHGKLEMSVQEMQAIADERVRTSLY